MKNNPNLFAADSFKLLQWGKSKGIILFYGFQGGILYKAPLTATVFKDFSSCYHHLAFPNKNRPEEPFVYVDARGVKLVTNVMDELESSPDGVFALSVAQDGWVEMLALYEAS